MVIGGPCAIAEFLLVPYIAIICQCAAELMVDRDSGMLYCEHGSLGCGIGYGYLHRIPTRTIESASPKAFPPSASSSPVKAPVPLAGFNEVSLLLSQCGYAFAV